MITIYGITLITLGILSIYRGRKEGGGDKWTVMVARARRCCMQYYGNAECYDFSCDDFFDNQFDNCCFNCFGKCCNEQN